MKVTDNEKEKYSRECPNCFNKLYYNWRSDFYTARKKESRCKSCMINNGHFKNEHKLNDKYNVAENSIDKLLNETNQSFYWLGFLIADGSFHDSTFDLGLAEKDKEHLEEFSKFISYNKEIKYRKESKSYRLTFNNKTSIPKVMSKYCISNNKTYNPIKFDIFKDYDRELLLSLLIGVIDGDGHIARNGGPNAFSIKITAHEVWESFYKSLFECINLPFNIVKVNNTNTITIAIYRKEYINILIENISINKIYHLNRKWNKIFESRNKCVSL